MEHPLNTDVSRLTV